MLDGLDMLTWLVVAKLSTYTIPSTCYMDNKLKRAPSLRDHWDSYHRINGQDGTYTVKDSDVLISLERSFFTPYTVQSLYPNWRFDIHTYSNEPVQLWSWSEAYYC